MNVILIGILGLRKVFGNMRGVAIMTQPLSSIMEEKMKNQQIKTAVLTMTGKLKNEILEGAYPVIIGHPESWGSSRGKRLLLEMKKRNMILLVGN